LRIRIFGWSCPAQAYPEKTGTEKYRMMSVSEHFMLRRIIFGRLRFNQKRQGKNGDVTVFLRDKKAFIIPSCPPGEHPVY
jgi:hypothetical protein